MVIQNMTIVARQNIWGLLEPIFVGLGCFCISGVSLWLIHPFSWGSLLLATWFCLGGLVFTFAGVRLWRPEGIGLVLDRQGLWWKYRRLLLLPWDNIAGVKLVDWTNEGVKEQGILVGLRKEDHGAFSPSEMNWFTEQLQRQFGPLPWQKVIMLHHDKWEWNPMEIVESLEASLADPAMREQW